MTTLPETVQDVIAEMKLSIDDADTFNGGNIVTRHAQEWINRIEAATALQSPALSGEVVEPVAWLWLQNGRPVNAFLHKPNDSDDDRWRHKGMTTKPLYLASPAQDDGWVRVPRVADGYTRHMMKHIESETDARIVWTAIIAHHERIAASAMLAASPADAGKGAK